MIRDPSDGSVKEEAMIRPDYILHEIDVTEWTEAEAFDHLKRTFGLACRDFPDIVEPHMNRIDDNLSIQEAKKLMRAALRETFTLRWPNRFAKTIGEGT